VPENFILYDRYKTYARKRKHKTHHFDSSCVVCEELMGQIDALCSRFTK